MKKPLSFRVACTIYPRRSHRYNRREVRGETSDREQRRGSRTVQLPATICSIRSTSSARRRLLISNYEEIENRTIRRATDARDVYVCTVYILCVSVCVLRARVDSFPRVQSFVHGARDKYEGPPFAAVETKYFRNRIEFAPQKTMTERYEGERKR